MKNGRSTRTNTKREGGVTRRGFLQTVGGAAVAAAGAGIVGLPSAAEAAGAGSPAQIRAALRADVTAAEARAVRAQRARLPLRKRAPLDSLSLNTFRRHLNTKFRVQADPGGVDLKLIEAKDRNTRKVAGLEMFSVIFSGPAGTPLPQDTYKFSHSALDKFDLFIVPVGKDKRGMIYEAVFNRFTR